MGTHQHAEGSIAPILLIITGPPAAGKTTLATRLAADLALPLFTKDLFKEALFDTVGWEDRAWSSRLGITSYRLLYLVARQELAAGRSLIIEANFDPRRAGDELRALRSRFPFTAVQVFCTAEREVLLRRFLERDARGERHPGHVDQVAYHDLESILERCNAPIEFSSPVISVDTTDLSAIDYSDILRQVRENVGSG